MNRLTGLGLLALSYALIDGRASPAGEVATDVNIITALDISSSIGPDDMRNEIEGTAQAIRAPEVLQAIQAGRYGRIGFAVFAWHHDAFPMLVSWMLIASEEDALVASRQIEARLRIDVEAEARNGKQFYVGRLTDLSQAIDHAAAMLLAAPYATDRAIVNIIGNGEDNVGDDAQEARDRAVAMGATVNGVALDGDPSLLGYYRRQVIGGPGAFALPADDSATLVEVLTRKFLYDIVMDRRHRRGVIDVSQDVQRSTLAAIERR